MWLTFGRNLTNIHIDLGSDQTSYIIRTQDIIIQLISFEDANAMMAENPYYSKKGTGNITPSHYQ
jgi:hypothetical protein